MKSILQIIALILCVALPAIAEKPQAISNQMLLEKIELSQTMLLEKVETTETKLLEKIELYQKVNNKKFELVFTEIKNLREDMNKRFEQVDKRFEQVDKRFEFIQAIILFLLTLTVGTPVVIEIWRQKNEKKKEILQREFDGLSYVLSEVAKFDERYRNAIKSAIQKGKILPANMEVIDQFYSQFSAIAAA